MITMIIIIIINTYKKEIKSMSSKKKLPRFPFNCHPLQITHTCDQAVQTSWMPPISHTPVHVLLHHMRHRVKNSLLPVPSSPVLYNSTYVHVCINHLSVLLAQPNQTDLKFSRQDLHDKQKKCCQLYSYQKPMRFLMFF